MEAHYHTSRPAAFIIATGEDAPRFLQSQFSNDIEGEGRRCAWGLWLDRKGRIAADSFILRLNGGRFGILSYHSQAADIIAKLDQFIIADDVELNDMTDTMNLTSLWGPGAAGVLKAWGFHLPEPGHYGEQGGMWLLRGRRSEGDSYDLVYDDEAEDWVLQRLAEDVAGVDLHKVGVPAVELERIRSGIPAIPRDCGPEGAIPQDLGVVDAGVSFTKGCFIGQEVMARVKMTDRHTRQLVRVGLDGDPGTLPAVLTSGDEPAGELTSATQAADKSWIGLALLRRKVIDSGRKGFATANGFTAVVA